MALAPDVSYFQSESCAQISGLYGGVDLSLCCLVLLVYCTMLKLVVNVVTQAGAFSRYWSLQNPFLALLMSGQRLSKSIPVEAFQEGGVHCLIAEFLACHQAPVPLLNRALAREALGVRAAAEGDQAAAKEMYQDALQVRSNFSLSDTSFDYDEKGKEQVNIQPATVLQTLVCP